MCAVAVASLANVRLEEIIRSARVAAPAPSSGGVRIFAIAVVAPKRTLRRQRRSLRRRGPQFEECRRPHLVISLAGLVAQRSASTHRLLTAGLRVVSWLCSRSGVSQNRRELDCLKSYWQSSCP